MKTDIRTWLSNVDWFVVVIKAVILSAFVLSVLSLTTTVLRSRLAIAQDGNVKEFLTERYSASYAEMVDLTRCKQLCAPDNLDATDHVEYNEWLKNKKEVPDGR